MNKQAEAPTGWTRVAARKARFSALFPGRPIESSQRMPSGVLGHVDAMVYGYGTSQAGYYVLLLPLRSEVVQRLTPVRILEVAADGAAQACASVSNKALAVFGAPARVTELDCGKDGRTKILLVLVAARLYEVMVVAPGELPSDADWFLSSFVPEM